MSRHYPLLRIRRPLGISGTITLLALVVAACEATPAPSSPGPSASASASPTPVPLPIPTPTPEPVSSGTPVPPWVELSKLSEADVIARRENLDIDAAWISPGGSKLVFNFERWQDVDLRDGRSLRRLEWQTELLDLGTGQRRVGLDATGTRYNTPVFWLDEQGFAALRYDEAREENSLVRTELGGTQPQELGRFKSAFSLRGGQSSDGWYYGGLFAGAGGHIKGIELSTGLTRQWPLPASVTSQRAPNGSLTLMPLPASKRILMIEDRTQPEPSFPYPSASPGSQPFAVATSIPIHHAHLLNTDSGEVVQVPELQGHGGWGFAAPDGSRFAWSSYGNQGDETWIFAPTGPRLERVLQGQLQAWLSPSLVLLEQGDQLEVAEVATGAIKATLKRSSSRTLQYDPASKHLISWEYSGYDGKTPLAIYVQSLREPERPGDERVIRVFSAEEGARFQSLSRDDTQASLFVVDRQYSQGPLAFYHLKADASELELLFSEPFVSDPKFPFDPTGGWQ